MTAPADSPPAGRRQVGRAGAGVQVRAHAPGRVNLIGDHTDYMGGWVLPMAIQMGTTVELRRHGRRLELLSADEPQAAVVELGAPRVRPPGRGDQAQEADGWARYPAGVVRVLDPEAGGTGVVWSDLPIGAGLSSSSALTVAVALALGFSGTELELARLCQQAETAGSGVPGGIMDQLCSAAGRPGSALLIDCRSLEIREVPIPPGWEVGILHSGRPRRLVGSDYGQRRAQCEQAQRMVGPLREATPAEVERLADPVLRRRARHVVSENRRVREMTAAMAAGDLPGAGRLLLESHRSLAEDFGVSTPELDALVEQLVATPGVAGARLTGAGFGGCVVALGQEGWLDGLDPSGLPGPAWRALPSGGAELQVIG